MDIETTRLLESWRMDKCHTINCLQCGTGDKRDNIEASSQVTVMIHPQNSGLNQVWVWHTKIRVGLS
jgi:Zn ribbon nucleic-acid-binding protein